VPIAATIALEMLAWDLAAQLAGEAAARRGELAAGARPSPPYRVLSLSARRVLDRISIELAHHGGNDNGKLPVTYEQFVEYGIDRQAIAPAIRELVALGFIEVTRQGKASASEYRRSEQIKDVQSALSMGLSVWAKTGCASRALKSSSIISNACGSSVKQR
jgi:hypothetical protein